MKHDRSQTQRKAHRLLQLVKLFSEVGCNMGDSITGLSGAGGSKLDSLLPHGVQLRVAILQGNHTAEHDVDAC